MASDLGDCTGLILHRTEDVAIGVGAIDQPARHQYGKEKPYSRDASQFVEQLPGCQQINRLEALSEPAINLV